MLHPQFSDSMFNWATWRLVVTDASHVSEEVMEMNTAALLIIGMQVVILCLAIFNVYLGIKRRR